MVWQEGPMAFDVLLTSAWQPEAGCKCSAGNAHNVLLFMALLQESVLLKESIPTRMLEAVPSDLVAGSSCVGKGMSRRKLFLYVQINIPIILG